MGPECLGDCKSESGAPLFEINVGHVDITIKLYDNRVEHDESNFVEHVDMLSADDLEVGEDA